MRSATRLGIGIDALPITPARILEALAAQRKAAQKSPMLDELPPFDYVDAATLAEAVAALTEHGPRAQVLAGGTDLLGLMKDRISGPGMPVPEVLVNVKRIPELHGIAETADGGLRIGAAVTLADLERDARVTARFPALAQAAAAVATTQIRAMGTVGGNLCQRPWCWYFRHPQFPCLKRGGTQCFALPGSNRTYFGVLGLGRVRDVAPLRPGAGADRARRARGHRGSGRTARRPDRAVLPRAPQPHRDRAGAGRDPGRGRRPRAGAGRAEPLPQAPPARHAGTSRSPRWPSRPRRGPRRRQWPAAGRTCAWLSAASRRSPIRATAAEAVAGRPRAQRVAPARGGGRPRSAGRARSRRTATRST